jgi:hypothetical protein
MTKCPFCPSGLPDAVLDNTRTALYHIEHLLSHSVAIQIEIVNALRDAKKEAPRPSEPDMGEWDLYYEQGPPRKKEAP